MLWLANMSPRKIHKGGQQKNAAFGIVWLGLSST